MTKTKKRGTPLPEKSLITYLLGLRWEKMIPVGLEPTTY
jgi:hypothetical protein